LHDLVARKTPGHRQLRELTMPHADEASAIQTQAAPTIRVSQNAFGSGRDMPIAQRWRREPAKWVV
jgi:hypothetical protein